jgi:hypothetical protein
MLLTSKAIRTRSKVCYSRKSKSRWKAVERLPDQGRELLSGHRSELEPDDSDELGSTPEVVL